MEDWITTSEAAARLGVKRETLYSYVSRAVLSSKRMGRGESLFSRAEIDQFAVSHGDGRRTGERLLRFRTVATGVSQIRGDQLFFRDRDLSEICRELDFAGAARLVVDTDECAELPVVDTAIVQGFTIERRIPLLVAMIAASDRSPTDPNEVGPRVLGLLPRLAESVPEIDFTHPWTDLLATVLIDNGLAASTIAARIAASARAGVFDALCAGYAALSGALHGGAPVAARSLLDSVIDGMDPDRAVATAAVDGRVPGFGHVLYSTADPRARIVVDRVRRDHPGADSLAAADEISSRVRAPMNIDLAGAIVLRESGLAPSAGEVLFQYGRTVGMAAHIAEEYCEVPLRWRGSRTV